MCGFLAHSSIYLVLNEDRNIKLQNPYYYHHCNHYIHISGIHFFFGWGEITMEITMEERVGKCIMYVGVCWPRKFFAHCEERCKKILLSETYFNFMLCYMYSFKDFLTQMIKTWGRLLFFCIHLYFLIQ